MLCQKNIAILEGDRHQVDSRLDSIHPHMTCRHQQWYFCAFKNCFVHQIHMCQKTNICKQSFDFFCGKFIKTVFHCSHFLIGAFLNDAVEFDPEISQAPIHMSC